MTIEFDSTNKWILLPDLSPNYTITAQTIYNEVMDWADNQYAIDNDLPMSATGFANLGGGSYSDKIFILINGWKLKPHSGTYTLTVIGTIIALDEEGNSVPREVPPDSGTVHFVYQVTSQGIISVTGSGVTSDDIQAIADKVEVQTGVPIKTKVNPLPLDPASESGVIELQNQLTDVQIQTTIIEKHHVLRRKIEGDYIKYYDGVILMMKYRMVKDGDGNIIELIPEAV